MLASRNHKQAMRRLLTLLRLVLHGSTVINIFRPRSIFVRAILFLLTGQPDSVDFCRKGIPETFPQNERVL